MPKYKTIHQFAVEYDFPEHRLRQWVKQGRVPGWYSGNRFMIDVELFFRQLRKETVVGQRIENEHQEWEDAITGTSTEQIRTSLETTSIRQ